MTFNKLEIPEKNGELLCIPHLNLIPQLIKTNKEKIKAYNFTIGYEGFHEFRKRLREKVILLSEKFTANLGIKLHIYNNSDTIIQTGHQPVFYHPGIMIKNFLLNKLSIEESINAINLTVDTDNFKEIGINTPIYSDGIKIINETLLLNPFPMPYELSSAPSWDTFRLFSKKIEKYLSHPYFNNLHKNFSGFIKSIGTANRNLKTISDFMIFVRRKYEDEVESQYLEIPVSDMCNTDEFLLFFMAIATDSKSFASVYNHHLEIYRKEHKLRYPANPFPNLAIEDGKIELPFWHFYKNPPLRFPLQCFAAMGAQPLPCGERDGVRGRVFAKTKDDTVIVCFEGGDSIEFNKKRLYKGIDLIKKNNIKIRPKAMILTLFNRLFVSDAFIHGVGGAKYDRITDNIMRDFYNIEPTDFVTASLTLYPSVDFFEENLQNKIKELESRMRNMRYNPEKYSKDNALLKEKENLISILKTDNTNKKEISIKLKEINEMIYQKIEPAVGIVEREIKTLRDKQEGLEAIQRRDYPYFLFSPGDIMRIISSMGQRGK